MTPHSLPVPRGCWGFSGWKDESVDLLEGGSRPGGWGWGALDHVPLHPGTQQLIFTGWKDELVKKKKKVIQMPGVCS